MINIKKHLHLFWLELTRPYPFQLWIAPRKKKWCFARPEAGPKPKSPPGFGDKQTEYAMYLYPDSISTYWWIYFFSSVCLHFILDIFILNIDICSCQSIKYIAGCLFFIVSYCSIYIIGRKSVLDELWQFWPETLEQKEYFKNICSRTTLFLSEKYSFINIKHEVCNMNLSRRVRLCEDDACNYILDRLRCILNIIRLIIFELWKVIEAISLRRHIRLKSTHYFNRPIFFNPRGSIQEGMLRAAIADFFAVNKKSEFTRNIFIYYLPHVWISFIYLSGNLLFVFRWHPYNNQNETIPLVILIVVWAVVSVPIFFKQYIAIKLFYDYDKKLFKFSPKRIDHLFKQKMRFNEYLVKSLDPKKTFTLLHAAAFGSYLVILNLVMQYENPQPPKTETNKPAAEQKVENQCRHVQINIIESPPCEEKCCF